MGRGHIEIIQESDVAPDAFAAPGWPVGGVLARLSGDEQTGALSAVLSLPSGYRRGPGSAPHGQDLFLISGTLRIGETVRAPGFYQHTPAHALQRPWVASSDCRVLLLSAGSPEFLPGEGDADAEGRIDLDTERVQWRRGSVPGPPPGLFSKTLRHDPETGARVFLCGSVRRYEYPLIEYHDCHEEAYHLAGDMRMGTSGEMKPGSYFWRPPYISHGPFYSHEGMMALMTVDGPLINHFVTDPRRTPEENRAQAQAEGPPRDYYAASTS